jgi:hypothetical protein
MTFTFENKEECKKFKKYLYWKIWRIELWEIHYLTCQE